MLLIHDESYETQANNYTRLKRNKPNDVSYYNTFSYFWFKYFGIKTLKKFFFPFSIVKSRH
jgi:hypothetical protein